MIIYNNMYTAIMLDADATKNFLPYESENLDNVRMHIARTLAKIIDDEIHKNEIDIDNTQYKNLFRYDRGRFRVKERENLEEVSNFLIMMYIQGYNTRVVEWRILSDDVEDEENQVEITNTDRLENLLPTNKKCV